MKVSKLFSLVVAILIGGYSTVAVAQNKLTWDKLGTEAVDYAIDHDVVSVKNGAQPYSALKIKVVNGTVNVHKATVHFTNGDNQDIDLPEQLTPGNDGKLIDLVGNKRLIEKVTFWYDTKNSNNSKAVVEVWGKI